VEKDAKPEYVVPVARRAPAKPTMPREPPDERVAQPAGGKASSGDTRKRGMPMDMHKALVGYAKRVLEARDKKDHQCGICYRPIREKTMVDHLAASHPRLLQEARELLVQESIEAKTNKRKTAAELLATKQKEDMPALIPSATRRIVGATKAGPAQQAEPLKDYESARMCSNKAAVRFAYNHPVVSWRGEECHCFICDKAIPKKGFMEHMKDHGIH